MIVAYEKHGTRIYADAVACVRSRVNDGWWYYDKTEQRAREIVLAADRGDLAVAEDLAWRFLDERGEHEYEHVEEQEATR